ncbi:MAG TPA: hypothetical protein VND21_04555 [Planctomycetota bacterium]|nr:hypothetical protein [Planctomycetota bacterium]
MARPEVPDALAMRRLKYGVDVPPAERDRAAEKLRTLGRRAEAILLYERHADHPSIRDDLTWAVKEGAAFHVFLLKRMGLEVTDASLRSCAEAAEAHSRWYDAHRCWNALKDEAGLARVAERLPGYKPAVPANKV